MIAPTNTKDKSLEKYFIFQQVVDKDRRIIPHQIQLSENPKFSHTKINEIIPLLEEMIEVKRLAEGKITSKIGFSESTFALKKKKTDVRTQRVKKRSKQFFSYKNLRKLSDKLDSSKKSAQWIKEQEENVSILFKQEESDFIQQNFHIKDINFNKLPMFERLKCD